VACVRVPTQTDRVGSQEITIKRRWPGALLVRLIGATVGCDGGDGSDPDDWKPVFYLLDAKVWTRGCHAKDVTHLRAAPRQTNSSGVAGQVAKRAEIRASSFRHAPIRLCVIDPVQRRPG